MSYIPGKVRAICDRCGFEYPLADLMREWSGLYVCRKDFDPRPPEQAPPRLRPEGVAKRNARPDNQTDESPNTATPQDL